jgi:Pregnancy-associated plasma protein-A
MNFFYFFALAYLSFIGTSYHVDAHIKNYEHRDDQGEPCGHNHDESKNQHDSPLIHHHHFEHKQQGLRNTLSSSIIVGNQTYSSREALFKSGKRCGFKSPTAKQLEESSRVMKKWSNNELNRLDQTSSVEIETYFHVITAGTLGALSNSDLQNQLTVLNDLYRPHGFSFKLLKTTRTESAAWLYAGVFSSAELAMKTALKMGGASTLNVYFNFADGNAGYATPPDQYTDFPVWDGVVIDFGTIPGGSSFPYNEGKTLVHEVGHWLGLDHTFTVGEPYFPIIGSFLDILGLRNGCISSGDGVSDTPRQSTATRGCPIGKDSCPFRFGLDAINNYMDYSDDACYTEFTPGQEDRMWAMWSEYRA